MAVLANPWADVASASRFIEGRIDSQERRIDGVRRDVDQNTIDVAVLKTVVADVVISFHKLTTALYTVAGTVVIAALCVIAFGHPL